MLVWCDILVSLHLSQNLESAVNEAFVAVSFDDCRVCDHVRMNIQFRHRLEQTRDAAHVVAAGTRVQKRIEGGNGWLNALLSHLLVNLPQEFVAALQVAILYER